MRKLQWLTRILASPRRHEELRFDAQQWSVLGGHDTELLDAASVRARFSDEPFRRVKAFEAEEADAFSPSMTPLLGRRPIGAAERAGWIVVEDADRRAELRRDAARLRVEPDGHWWLRVALSLEGVEVGSGTSADVGAVEELLVLLAEGGSPSSNLAEKFYWREHDADVDPA
ncbi:hypothetical protein [Arenivirga flava]|uniref:Uncharacterized protein n=1 Tax=Arenivirga flava TaxID=1930060 RepID=A0AA37UR16_9MICO|nr:hypothetical protein [Arenivirga flava]GMA27247.1 hypothetical protein GCM10025874_05000 [Arenivirga flava]